MDQSKLALTRELGQLFGHSYRGLRTGTPDTLITLEREKVLTCGHCGAWVRLIGIPPKTLPGDPKVALYYPDQFCPNCGNVVARALNIELFPLPGIPGAAVYHKITCPQCASKLEYVTQALPPQYLDQLYCPVCGISLGVEGQEVGVLEEAPWPAVAAEEPWQARTKLIVGVGLIITGVVGLGIHHAVKRKSRR